MAKKTVAVTRRRNQYTVVKRSRGRRKFTLPLAAIMGFAPLFSTAYSHFKLNGLQSAANAATLQLTGYSVVEKRWAPQNLYRGLVPIVVGILIHSFVGGRMGVNRALASAGVPLIRL